jgi:YHS domain-containing protein
MAWAVWWALVLGFAISAVVQAWVPRERVERALGGGGVRPIVLATGLGAAGLIPQTRPSRSDIFGSVALNCKLFTNLLGLAVFAALFALTMRRGATDPVCGMSVDRAKAVQVKQAGKTSYFCSEHCARAFTADTSRPPA